MIIIKGADISLGAILIGQGGEVRNLYLHVDNVMKCDGTTNYRGGKLRCQI